MTHARLISGVTDAAAADPDVNRLLDLYANLESELSKTLQQHLTKLESEPSWALLHSMSARAMEQQRACITLYSLGYYAPAEALCRTVVEAAINLYYCSLGDSCMFVLSYFRSYIETERKQNKSWRTSVASSSQSQVAKQIHLDRIAAKEEALTSYEMVLREAFSQIGLKYEQASKTWPSMFDRFKAIDKEVEYRTVYAALCSQAHNDAEDLLNDFVHAVSQVAGAHEVQACENKNFSLYMVLTALAFLAEATLMYLAKYNLSVNDPFQRLLADVWSFIEQIAQRKNAMLEKQ